MRLNFLTVCLCVLGLSACATSHTTPHTQFSNAQLQQKATQGLNALIEQPSYHFNTSIKLDLQNKESFDSLSQRQQQLKFIEQIAQHYQLHQHPVIQTFKQNTLQSKLPSQSTLHLLSQFVQDSELHTQGTIDLRNKKFNLNLLAQYHGENINAQLHLPILLDLNQKQILVNATKHPNAITSAHQQVYTFDLSEYSYLLESINLKHFIDFAKQTNAMTFTLLGNERLEYITPTASERQQGAVEKIRLHSDVETIMLKNMIFDQVHQKFLDEKLIDNERLEQLIRQQIQQNYFLHDEFSKEEQDLKVLLDTHLQKIQQQSAQQKSSNAKTALAKAQPANIDELLQRIEYKKQEISQGMNELEQCANAIHNGVAIGKIVDCYGQYPHELFDENENDQVADTSLLYAITQYKQKHRDLLKKFEQYNQGNLLTHQQFAEILEKHKNDIKLDSQSHLLKVTLDTTLDQSGRVIHSLLQLSAENLAIPETKQHISPKLEVHSHFSDYGKAKIQPFNIGQPKPLREMPLAQRLVKKFTLLTNFDDKIVQHSEQLAKELYLQNKSYQEIYQAIFVLFASQNPVVTQHADLESLKELSLFFAHHAEEKTIYPLIQLDNAQLQHIQDKYDLSTESIFADYAYMTSELMDFIKNEILEQDTNKNLAQKSLTPEQLFAELYTNAALLSSPQAKLEIVKETSAILAQLFNQNRQTALRAQDLNILQKQHLAYVNSDIFIRTKQRVEKILKLRNSNTP